MSIIGIIKNGIINVVMLALFLTLNILRTLSRVSIVYFEQLNVYLELIYRSDPH